MAPTPSMRQRPSGAARARIRLACLLVLLAASAAPGQTPPREPRGDCAINRFDGPFSPGGFASATGFAVDRVHGAPVEKIELFLDGKPGGEGFLRGLRPDVMAHFTRQDYLWSGWSGAVSLEGVAPGKHSLAAVAVLRSGQRLPCVGPSAIDVLAVEDDRDPSPLGLGAVIFLRTVGVLIGLTLVGWAAAGLLRLRPLPLAAPFLGLGLFAVFGEWAAAAGVRPFVAATVLVLLALVSMAVMFRGDRDRLRPEMRESAPSLLAALTFALIGVIPLAAHGQGAVLGDIDDAVRECSYADAISRYGWDPPASVQGYLGVIPKAMERISVRRGGTLLLSALGQRFSARAHEVHATASLAGGCLVVLGAGLLASRVLRRFPRGTWIAPALAAINSTLLATLYGQHLGSLLGAALFLPFVYFLLGAIREGTEGHVLGLGLTSAAGLTVYPETMAAWALAGVFALFAAARGTKGVAAKRLLIAAALAVALNPVGLTRAGRFASYTATVSREMSSPYSRTIAGDTHYFPSLNVVAGIEAYRDDARAPVGAARRLLIPLCAVGILLVVALGWTRLQRSEKSILLVLVGPAAIALFSNYRLGFPYGFAKFLPFAVGLWCVAFALLVCAAGSRDERPPWKGLFAYGTLGLVLLLSVPSARHVVARAARAIPAYDPAFLVLPALADALPPGAVFRLDEPLVARRQWICYFLGENAVEYESADGPERRPDAAGPRFQLVDKRDPDHRPAGRPAASTRFFAAVPLPPGS